MTEEDKRKVGGITTEIAGVVYEAIKDENLSFEEQYFIFCMLPTYFIHRYSHMINGVTSKIYEDYLELIKSTMECAIGELEKNENK